VAAVDPVVLASHAVSQVIFQETAPAEAAAVVEMAVDTEDILAVVVEIGMVDQVVDIAVVSVVAAAAAAAKAVATETATTETTMVQKPLVSKLKVNTLDGLLAKVVRKFANFRTNLVLVLRSLEKTDLREYFCSAQMNNVVAHGN